VSGDLVRGHTPSDARTSIGVEGGDAALRAQAACLELIASSFAWVDEGHATAVAELFTEDGVQAVNGAASVGRQQIRAALANREADSERRTLHVVTNTKFRAVTSDHAAADSIITLYLLSSPAPERLRPRALSLLEDQFVCLDEVWRLARRTVTILAGQR
jgi:uncharacterized protein (TIGR02246 family)